MRQLMERIPWLLAIAVMFPGGMVSQQAEAPIQLPGTTLRVLLPTGWKLEPPRLSNQQHLLTTNGEPRYELWVSQTTQQSFGYSCMGFIGSMKALPGLSTSIQPRPAFVPRFF